MSRKAAKHTAPEPVDTPDARQRLLETAQAVFGDRGFDGAKVRDICKGAGVNIAGINYHFGGKEELYIEAVKHAHTCARMESFPVLPPGTPPSEKLKGFIREMVARMHTPTSPAAMKLMMREMADPGKAADIVVKEFIQPVAFALRDILRELLPDCDERKLLATGFSIIGQILFYRQNRPVTELIFGKEAVDALDVNFVTDHIICFTLAALGLAQPAELPNGRKPRNK
jgi:AcrR family transcriptional regulator